MNDIPDEMIEDDFRMEQQDVESQESQRTYSPGEGYRTDPDLVREFERFRTVWCEIQKAHGNYWKEVGKCLASGSAYPNPNSYEPLKAAQEQYEEALNHPDSTGFKPLSTLPREWALYELRNKVAVIRVKPSKKGEEPRLDSPERRVSGLHSVSDRPIAEAFKEIPIFEEIPIGILSYSKVAGVPLSGWSDEDLRMLWFHKTDRDPSAEEIAWLRPQSLPVPKKRLIRKRSEDNPYLEWNEDDWRLYWIESRGRDPMPGELEALRKKHVTSSEDDPAEPPQGATRGVSRRLWRELELPFLDFEHLIVTPLNLVRAYHMPFITPPQKERLFAAIGGWMLSVAIERHYMGTGNTENLSDYLPSSLVIILNKSKPPELIVREVESIQEMMALRTQILPLGAARATLWCRRFKEEALNDLSTTEGFRDDKTESFDDPDRIPVETEPMQISSTVHEAESKLSFEQVLEDLPDLRERLERLTPAEQQVLLLQADESKYTHAEIAKILGKSINTISVLAARGEKRLQGEIKPARHNRHKADSEKSNQKKQKKS